jgi:hypothetical protein
VKVGQCDPSGDEVAHVDIHRRETGPVKSRRHFDLTVDALLAQDSDAAAARHWR